MMKFLEKIRAVAFWALDAKRGGSIKRHLRMLSKIEGTPGVSDSEAEAYQRDELQKLLSHCVKTVPAFSHLEHTLSKKMPIELWPVCNKMTFKNVDKGGYLSTNFDPSSLIPMRTSGSTGTPFTSWQNADKKRHVNAEVLHYNGKIGYSIGRRIIYFRSVVTEVAKSPLQQFMQNIHLIDCSDLSDDGIRDKLTQIKKLSSNGGAMILSYASTLDAFRRYFDKYGMEDAEGCNIYGIVSGSEMLQDATRASLSEAFHCKVVSRYSNEENGFLGQDDELNNVFLHNRANYYVEILKLDSDEPAEVGEIGRIVITDLFNYAMPMIRYDTGDVGAWQYVSAHGIKRKAIGNFGGRKVDTIFDADGKPISPHSITNCMWSFQQIIQFQFIQTGQGSYKMKLQSDGKIDETALKNQLSKIVGKQASIHIEYCNEIPVLASGKRRYIVNLTQSSPA